MRDLRVLKMHLLRDEQETFEQLIDELGALMEAEEEPSLEDLFRGNNYQVRYYLNRSMFEDDE